MSTQLFHTQKTGKNQMWSSFCDIAPEWLIVQNIQFPTVSTWKSSQENILTHQDEHENFCFVDLGEEIQEKTSQN